MGAFLKQAVTLLAGKMAGSNNKATFVVKTARTVYTTEALLIAIVWYSAWRNERVQPGKVSFPIPGMRNLKRQYPPDRPEQELDHEQKLPAAEGGGVGHAGPKPSNSRLAPHAIPQTTKAALAVPGLGTYEGKPVALWIVPYLNYAKLHGWTGTLTQGYRTYAEEVSIWNSGVRPAARPGTSNHGKKVFPGGAVDVTEPEQLNRILKGLIGGSLLVWAGAQDTVHFSHPHNGSY